MENDIYEGQYIKYGLKFNCRVGMSGFINNWTTENKSKEYAGEDKNNFNPCQFYVRY